MNQCKHCGQKVRPGERHSCPTTGDTYAPDDPNFLLNMIVLSTVLDDHGRHESAVGSSIDSTSEGGSDSGGGDSGGSDSGSSGGD